MSDLLDLAVHAHGDLDRWRQIKSIEASFSATGRLWAIKGFPQGLPNVTMTVDTKTPKVTTQHFLNEFVSHFTPDRVSIVDKSGISFEELDQPRASFAGHTLQTQLNLPQLAYFFSYAFWNYFTTPFLFTQNGFKVSEIKEPYFESNERWRRLKVVFPDKIPTHCQEQIFYFNEKGYLQRLDYVTDILGGVAAHYCFDHQVFEGITIPTMRRVVRRSEAGSHLSDPTAVLVQIFDIKFH